MDEITAVQIGAQMVTDLAKSFSSVLVEKMGKKLKDKKAKDAVIFKPLMKLIYHQRKLITKRRKLYCIKMSRNTYMIFMSV